MKGNTLQFEVHGLEPLLEILLPEEFGVAQSRRDHLLIARDDLLAAVLGPEVRHQKKLARELLGARLAQRKALLVRLHRGDQALRRYLEEGLVERAHEYDRPFGEAGVLRKQPFVFDERELGVGGKRVRLLGDELGAALGVEDHLVALQAPLVVGEARDLEGLVAVEVVTARCISRLDVGDLEGHHLTVKHTHDRMQRTDPAQLGAIVEGAVEAHGLGPGKSDNGLAQHLGDDLGRRPARPLDACEVIVALLLVGDDLRLFQRLQACCFQEALHGLLGRANARALALLQHGRRFLRHVADDEGQAARRRKGARLSCFEPARLEAVDHEPAQVLCTARLQARRDLFGEQLEQQL